MWRRLDDPDLIPALRGEYSAYDTPDLVAAALTELTAAEWAPRVWVATSLGKAWLTTAPSYREADKHGAVFIVQPERDEFVVFHVAAGQREGRHSLTCAGGELADTVAASIGTNLLK